MNQSEHNLDNQTGIEEELSGISEAEKLTVSRRKLITGFSAVVAAILVNPLCKATEAAQKSGLVLPDLGEEQRDLFLYCPVTKESLAVTYWENGRYSLSALRKVNYHFRDHYCGRVHVIDPNLLDYLFRIKVSLELKDPIHILSGYRTYKTNAMLRRHSSNVAKHSYHVYGRAVDIRVPGVPTYKLRKTAYNLKAGGVGYYKRQRFVHVDTGQFRSWWG